MLGDTTQYDTAQCYFTSKSPEILDWSKQYITEKEKYHVKEYSKTKKRKMDCISIGIDQP